MCEKIEQIKGEKFDNFKKVMEEALPEGAEPDYAFLTTYDHMDFYELEYFFCEILKKGNHLIEKGAYDVFCGQKSKLDETASGLSEVFMDGHIHRVCGEKSFHPKIYCVLYHEKENQNFADYHIALVLSSRNIAKSTALEAYVSLKGSLVEGEKSSGGQSNGGKLKKVLEGFLPEEFLPEKEENDSCQDFIQLLGESNCPKKRVGAFLKYLEAFCFSLSKDSEAEVTFLRPDKGLLEKLVSGNQEKPLLVVSPFVSNKILEICSSKDINMKLYSNLSELKKLAYPASENISFYYLKIGKSSEEAEGENSEKDAEKNSGKNRKQDDFFLHAKIYIKYYETKSKTCLYIGSANFTNSAFGDNAEILAEITFAGDKYDALKKVFNLSDTDEMDENGEKRPRPFWLSYERGEDGEPEAEAKGRIPDAIYKWINMELKISSLKKTGKDWKITYSLPKSLSEPDAKYSVCCDENNRTFVFRKPETDDNETAEADSVSICQTSSENKITRNVSILFKVKEKETEGSVTFDLFDLLSDLLDKANPEKKELSERIDRLKEDWENKKQADLVQRNKEIFRAGRIKRPKESSDQERGKTEDRKKTFSRIENGIFEVIKRKMAYEKRENIEKWVEKTGQQLVLFGGTNDNDKGEPKTEEDKIKELWEKVGEVISKTENQ